MATEPAETIKIETPWIIGYTNETVRSAAEFLRQVAAFGSPTHNPEARLLWDLAAYLEGQTDR